MNRVMMIKKRIVMIGLFLFMWMGYSSKIEVHALNLDLISGMTLDASQSGESITLTFSKTSLLGINLIGERRVVFDIPEEILSNTSDAQQNIQVEYKNALLGLGTYQPVPFYLVNNEILYSDINFTGLNLLSGMTIRVTITPDHFAPTSSGIYNFGAVVGKKDAAILDLPILSLPESGTAQLDAPRIAPTINSLTDQDLYVTGTGVPSSQIEVKDSNGNTWVSTVNTDGSYSFDFSERGPFLVGTQLTATTLYSDGSNIYRSPSVSTIVSGSISLNVPETITFPTIAIKNLDQVLSPLEDILVEVRDTRLSSPGWRLSVKSTAFTSNVDGQILDAHLFYKPTLDPTNIQYLEDGIQVMQGNQSQTINFSDLNDAIQLQVNPAAALIDRSYTSELTWTLENAP